MRPLKDKLNGDIDLASGHPDKAIKMYRTACRAARVEEYEGDTGQSPQDQAEAWQTHTAQALREALRDRRSERAGR